MTVTLSGDPSRLQLDRIHAWLSSSYWAQGVSRATIERAVAASICVGAYRGDVQIGFARAIADGVAFAWIADVIVDETERGHGVGRQMVAHLLAHPDIVDVRRVMLATRDAHGVYAALGFAAPQRPDLFMERPSESAAAMVRSW